MKIEATDRRSRKTEAAMEKAFLDLVSKKDINNITVKDVTEEADANRGTFYLHYIDILDLQSRVEDKLIDRLVENPAPENGRMTRINCILEYIRENRHVFNSFIRSSRSMQFLEKVSVALEEKLLPEGLLKTKEKDPVYGRRLSMFFTYGAVAVIKDWLTNDVDASPSELAEVIERIIRKGFSGLSE